MRRVLNGRAMKTELRAASRLCASCGAPARSPFRAPAPEGAPDLDLRPGEPTRSTLPRWIQTCPRCGASAPDLAALPAGAAEVVRSDAYRALREAPGSAAPFLRWAHLAKAVDNGPAAAAEATLQAAWALDDAEAEDAATPLRREAARLWGEPTDLESALRLIDVLRRAGEWDAAETRAAWLAAQPGGVDEDSARILAFQRARIAERDAGRHLISSVLRPPARTPHVTHKQPPPSAAPPGFWRRLFGG